MIALIYANKKKKQENKTPYFGWMPNIVIEGTEE